MATVTTSTLFSASRDVIVDLINSNVSDPKRGQTNSRRRWIYRQQPDTTSRDFTGYPLLIISHADISDEILTLTNTFRTDTFTFEIEIHTEFNDPTARNDTLADSIISVLQSNSGQTTLGNAGLFSPKILASDTVITTVNQKDVIVRTIILEVDNEFCSG